jgi:hypothetical protein
VPYARTVAFRVAVVAANGDAAWVATAGLDPVGTPPFGVPRPVGPS